MQDEPFTLIQLVHQFIIQTRVQSKMVKRVSRLKNKIYMEAIKEKEIYF